MFTEKEFLAQEGGAIIDEKSYNENDFKIGNIPKKSLQDYLDKSKKDNPRYFYNQYTDHNTRNSCTLFGSFGSVSDLTGHKFSKEEITEINNRAIKQGLDIHHGWRTWKAVDLVRNYWNEKHPDNKLISFSVDLTDKKLLKQLEELKTIVISYKTNFKHYLDSQDNGILDNKCFITCGAKITGGHCIRHNSGANIDNYHGRKKHNVYINKHLLELSKEGTYYKIGYVFFYEKDIAEIKYKYYNDDFKKLTTSNSKNLFFVMQRVLDEVKGYKPIFNTIIGNTEEETVNRILMEIHGARLFEQIKNSI